jgi:tRNA (guanine-N7-)-methyltransferase
VREHREMGIPAIPASEAWKFRSTWSEHFGRQAPLHLEIGSGNGFFLTGMAQQKPDWNWVGVEIRYKRVVICAKKLIKAGVQNARIIRYHGAFLDDLVEEGGVDGVYLNHPDPWPRERHEKNRIVSRWFMEDLSRFIKPGGWFRIKSDHLPNIERAISCIDRGPEGELLPGLPFVVNGRADDVTTGPAPWPDDVETNYQRKFRERGLPVYALELLRTDAPTPAVMPTDRVADEEPDDG